MDKGRPTKMTPELIDKLREYFAMAFTDDEACLMAGISRMTLHNYCKENPDFAEDRELLKKKPNLKAKMNIIKSINGQDINDSKWWLERKAKNEFSLKTEQEITGDLKVETITITGI